MSSSEKFLTEIAAAIDGALTTIPFASARGSQQELLLNCVRSVIRYSNYHFRNTQVDARNQLEHNLLVDTCASSLRDQLMDKISRAFTTDHAQLLHESEVLMQAWELHSIEYTRRWFSDNLPPTSLSLLRHRIQGLCQLTDHEDTSVSIGALINFCIDVDQQNCTEFENMPTAVRKYALESLGLGPVLIK